MDTHNTYNHSGVHYKLSDDAIIDAKECYGIDLQHMTNKAIDLTLKTNPLITAVSKISITVPAYTDSECTFQVNFKFA